MAIRFLHFEGVSLKGQNQIKLILINLRSISDV